MHRFALIAGLITFLVGAGYLFRPRWILNLNAWMREYVFKDAYVLLDRRRIGALLVLISIILLAIALQTHS